MKNGMARKVRHACKCNGKNCNGDYCKVVFNKTSAWSNNDKIECSLSTKKKKEYGRRGGTRTGEQV